LDYLKYFKNIKYHITWCSKNKKNFVYCEKCKKEYHYKTFKRHNCIKDDKDKKHFYLFGKKIHLCLFKNEEDLAIGIFTRLLRGEDKKPYVIMPCENTLYYTRIKKHAKTCEKCKKYISSIDIKKIIGNKNEKNNI